MQDKLKLSAIIIAKNEEENIGRCLESLVGCIDDIVVVVDDKSTDRTLEIVKSFENVSYFISEWKGYSATKQFAVEKTKYDWILWIDADEALTEELKFELLKFKESEPEYSVYSLARRAYFLGKWIKHSGWYPGRVERLFNKHKAKFSDSEVHEHLIYEGKAGELKNDLEHYTDPDIHHYFEKFNRYTTLAAKELQAKNKNATLNDLLLRPIFLFGKMYFIRLGFLDGLHGFVLAVFSSTYVFVKYAKLWQLNLGKK
jgi:glycosyltransferase involved in cell wall biosynthesis